MKTDTQSIITMILIAILVYLIMGHFGLFVEAPVPGEGVIINATKAFIG